MIRSIEVYRDGEKKNYCRRCSLVVVVLWTAFTLPRSDRERKCNMADGFLWYELVTNDIDKAVGFYKKVVGWDIKDSGMPGMRYMLFGKDGKDVGGMMTWAGAGAPEMPPEWMGHIHTAKLDEELKAVATDGGTIIKPAQEIPGVGRFAVVMDPQKVKYLLFEPARADAPPCLDRNGSFGNVGLR